MTTTIASAPISGYTYRTVCMYDFAPFSPDTRLTWGGFGTYSGVVGSTIRASIEIPAGALIRDVEYYIYNNSASAVSAESWIYVPGQGVITSIGALSTVAATSSIVASRAIVAPASYGPYPIGSRLLVGIYTPTDGSVQVNGVRVGFSHGAGMTGLLDSPVRAYDSRSGAGRIPRGGTRTITLPSSVVVPGTTGVLANITVVNGESSGYLKIYSAAAALPASSSINYLATTAIANAASISVSTGRQIKIFASTAADVIVDITGIIS